MADLYGASALTPRPVGAARRLESVRPVVELFMGGEVIAVDGVLTWEGCLCVIVNLWYLTARFLRSMEQFCDGEVDALSLDGELLGSCIEEALPRNVICSEESWSVLNVFARQMVVWHSEEIRSVGWDWLQAEELRRLVNSLYETCSAAAML